MEKPAWKVNGVLAIITILLLIVLSIHSFINLKFIMGIIIFSAAFLIAIGIKIIQPNQANVITFFGKYMGVVRESGCWFIIPFSYSTTISLRIRNFNSVKLKVNDVDGNPIEIAAVIVFKVVDSAKSVLDVDNYEQFVEIQSETALRHIATQYPYDDYNQTGYSLRGNTEEITQKLTKELQERLAAAGVEVIEARLTHLAYATEIASAMLQRQQASAILAARQIIVEGAVGMAQMALERLEKSELVGLDKQQKALMVNNLLVAIVSEKSAQPVINTGL